MCMAAFQSNHEIVNWFIGIMNIKDINIEEIVVQKCGLYSLATKLRFMKVS